MIGINYGDYFPWNRIELGEDVWMVDFCLQPFADMVRLVQSTHVIWIDHHESTIKEFQRSGFEIDGVREIGQSGCELTWEYIHGRRQKMPEGVRLLGRYDVWDHHSDDDVLPFQYGMRLVENTAPGDAVWEDVLLESPGFVCGTVHDGRIVMQATAQSNRVRCSAAAFETELDGLRCIALNCPCVNSQTFESVWAPEKHDAMLAFWWSARGFWTCSLYSEGDVDVSKVAVAHGGGGHTHASGFQCQELPFELKAKAREGRHGS